VFHACDWARSDQPDIFGTTEASSGPGTAEWRPWPEHRLDTDLNSRGPGLLANAAVLSVARERRALFLRLPRRWPARPVLAAPGELEPVLPEQAVGEIQSRSDAGQAVGDSAALLR
jgi:hypothetical protein